MATSQTSEQGIVTLSSTGSPAFPYPNRRIPLSKDTPTANIGRTSKRNDSLGATENNGWIDSAVMSRDHAQLRLDVENQEISIQDIGSTHGTFCNNERLLLHHPRRLKDGDVVKFGVAIERGPDRFLPCAMKVALQFGPDRSENRPVVFRVPDDTDVEDLTSDDDTDVRYSSQILRDNNIRPAKSGVSAPTITIDVESGEQCPLPNITSKVPHTVETPSRASKDGHSANEPILVDLTFSSRVVMDVDETSLNQAFVRSGDTNSKDVDNELDSPELEFEHSSQPESSDADDAMSDSLDWDDDSSVMSSSLMPVLPLSTDASGDDLDPDFIEEDDFVEEDDFSYPAASLDLLEGTSGNEVGSANAEVDEDEEASMEITSIPGAALEKETTTVTPLVEAREQQPHEQPDAINSHCSLVSVELPPISKDCPEDLRPFSSSQCVDPFDMRLPSIMEAVPCPATPQKSPLGTRSIADILGSKTGKFEYFAAREQNKMNAHTSSEMPAKGSDPVTWERPATDLLGNQKSTLHEDSCLDETSAHLFEKSKKAARMQVASGSRRTRMGIGNLINRHCDPSTKPKLVLKRKAAEISQGSAQEELDMAIKAFAASPGQASKSTVADTPTPALADAPLQPDGIPPVKRLRRFAEAVGYATLGGVAVISALVATAPAL